MDQEWKVKGWALGERLNKEEEEDWPASEPKLEVVWSLRTTDRPLLDDESSPEALEKEIDWIQESLVDVLNKHVRRITICARSKRFLFSPLPAIYLCAMLLEVSPAQKTCAAQAAA